jgi:CRISPR/Cas system CMR-associated protein Cmr1 (group 7 of RAMP superfamily)
MAQYEHLPIYRKAFDLAVFLENTVRGFSRYHKYTLGTDLRDLSREIVRLVIRVNSEKEKLATLQEVRVAIEGLKVTARISKEVKAFNNFNTFKQVMAEAISLSKQCEGWIKSLRGR